MNGGKKEDFEDLTMADITIIRGAWESYQQKQTNDLVERMGKMLGAEKVN